MTKTYILVNIGSQGKNSQKKSTVPVDAVSSYSFYHLKAQIHITLQGSRIKHLPKDGSTTANRLFLPSINVFPTCCKRNRRATHGVGCHGGSLPRQGYWNAAIEKYKYLTSKRTLCSNIFMVCVSVLYKSSDICVSCPYTWLKECDVERWFG